MIVNMSLRNKMAVLRRWVFVVVSLLLFGFEGIGQDCAVSIAPASLSICQGSSGTLTATITDGGTGPFTYTWKNGPTTVGGNTNTLTVTAAGTYTVTVNGGACTNVVSNAVTVTVNAKPTAGFTAPSLPCASTNIAFSNTSVGTGLQSSWNFGDPGSGSSNTSSLASPTHKFQTDVIGCGTKTFQVELNIIDNNNCTASITKSVEIKQKPDATLENPNAPIFGLPFTQCENLPSFDVAVQPGSNTCTNSTYLIQWGDGATSNFTNSTSMPINHVYVGKQAWTLSYVVTNDGCSNTANYTVYNGSNPNMGVQLSELTPNLGCAPHTVDFNITGWEGNPAGTVYIFNPGNGEDQVTYNQSNMVNVISYTYNQTSAGNQFIYNSIPVYNAFQVSINAQNNCPTPANYTYSPITVRTAPDAAFTVPTTNKCTNTNLTFTNTSQQGAYITGNSSPTLVDPRASFVWTFGDGTPKVTRTNILPANFGSTNSSTGGSVIHSFANPGNYTVTLKATNYVTGSNVACDTTIETHTVCISAPPSATDFSFSLAPSNANNCTFTGTPLEMTATTTMNVPNPCNDLTYNWTITNSSPGCLTGSPSFKSGSTAASLNPVIIFPGSGTYVVKLTVSNGCGSAYKEQTITVNSIPSVSVSSSAITICEEESVDPDNVFSITTCGPSPSYTWSFNGGTSTNNSTQAPPMNPVTYPSAAGSPFTMSINVSNVCGQTTGSKQITVKARPLPTFTGSPAGSACLYSTKTYTTQSGMTNYQWLVAAGNQIVSGGETYSNTITIKWNTTGSQWLSVNYNNTNNCNAVEATVHNVTVNTLPVISLTGDQTVCEGDAAVVYTTSASGASNYTWGVSTGGTITSGGTNTSTNATITWNTPGSNQYVSLNYTDANGCSATSALQLPVVVNPKPTAYTVSGGGSYCAGGTGKNITLSGSQTGVTYQLYNGSNPVAGKTLNGTNGPLTFTNITAAGTYTVEAVNSTTSCGRMMNGSATIAIDPLPIANAGNDATILHGLYTTLNGQGSGATIPYTFSWSPVGMLASNQANSQNPLTTNLFNTQTFSLVVTDSKGCVSTPDQVVITVSGDPLSVVCSANPATPICNGSSVVLTAEAAGGSNTYLYEWKNQGTGAVIGNAAQVTVTPSQTTTYVVTVNDNYNSTTCSKTVTVNPLPTKYNVLGSGFYCAGSNGREISLSHSELGVSYQLKLNGVDQGSPLTGTGTSLSFGFQLSAGNYTVKAANISSGCENNMNGSATIEISPLPVAHAGTDKTIAYGTSTSLQGTEATGNFPPFTYTWTPASEIAAGLTSLSPTTQNLETTTEFTIQAKDSRNCIGTDQMMVMITGSPIGIVSLTAQPATICAGETSVLSATVTGGGGSYTWNWTIPPSNTVVYTSTGATSSFSVSPSTTTTYKATVTDGYNSVNQTVSVTVNPLPTQFQVTGGGSYCSGGTGLPIGLSQSSSGITYTLMLDGVPASTPSLSGNNSSLSFGNQILPGIYTIKGVNTSTGCTQMMNGSKTIVVNPLPTASAGIDKTINAGTSTLLNGTASGTSIPLSYNWTPSASIATNGATLNPTTQLLYEPTAFTLTVTDVNNCIATDQMTVNITGSGLSIACLPETVSPICNNGTSVTLSVTASGGSGSYTYTWSSSPSGSYPPNTNSITVSPTTTTSYTVQVNDGFSSQSCSKVVTVNPLPNSQQVTGGGSYCSGSGGKPVGLTGSQVGKSYQLLLDGSPQGSPLAGTGNALNFGNKTVAGEYTVRAIDPNTGCERMMTGSATIIVNDLPTAQSEPDKSIPYGTATSLAGSGSGGNAPLSYSWEPVALVNGSQGATVNTENIYDNTTFTLTVTDANGCQATDQTLITLTGGALAVSCTISETEICNDGTDIILTSTATGGSGNYTYTWSSNPAGVTGSTSSITVNPTASTTYTISVTDGFNTATCSKSITVNPLPQAQNVTGGGEYCAGNSGLAVGISSSQNGIQYQLKINDVNTGSIITGTGQSISFGLQAQVGSYTVVASNPTTGCFNQMAGSASIAVNELPVANAGIDKTIPYGTSTNLEGVEPTNGTPGYTLSWSPTNLIASGGNTLTPATTNLYSQSEYTLTVQDSKGCVDTDVATVSLTGGPVSVTITGDPTALCYQANPTIELTAHPVDGSGNFIEYYWETVPSSSWNQTSTSPVISVHPTTTTQYRVRVNDGFNTAWSAPITITVYSLPIPQPVQVTNNGHYCLGGTGVSVSLGGSQSNVSYQLKLDGAPVGDPVNGTGAALPLAVVTAAGTYTVSATSAQGCLNDMSGTAIVIIDQLPVANAGPDKTIPNGTSTTLDATAATGGTPAQAPNPPYSYNWTPASSINGSATVLNPVTTLLENNTTYTLLVTDAQGCTDSDDMTVTITGTSLAVSATASPDAVCNNGTAVQLTATGSGGDATQYSFAWTGPNGWTSSLQNPTYTPQAGLTAVTNLSFTVTLTDTYQTRNATTTLTVHPLPTALSLSSSAPGYCAGTTMPTLTLSGSETGVNYQLLKNGNPDGSPVAGTGSALTFANKPAGVYTLEATSTFGCENTMTGEVTLSEWPLPTANAGPDFNINYGMTQLLTGTAGDGTTPYQKFEWADAANLQPPTILNNPPAGTLTLPVTTVNLNTTQQFTFTVTDGHGCVASDQTTVTVGGDPLTATIGATPGSRCFGTGTIQLNAMGVNGAGSNIAGYPYTYAWTSTPPNLLTTTNIANPVFTPATSGTFTFTVVVGDGYGTTQADATVTIHPLPSPFDVTGGGEYCAGGAGVAVGLNNQQPGISYQLYRGTTAVGSPVVGVAAAGPVNFGLFTTDGDYSVVATNPATGCTNNMNGTVTVTTNPLPVVFASAITPIAHGITTQLTGTASGGTGTLTYDWQPDTEINTGQSALNAVTNNLYANQLFTFTATDTKGCEATAQVEVVINGDPLSVLVQADPAIICQGETVQLTANAAGGSGTYTYSWSAGAWTSTDQNPVVTPGTTTTYTLTANDGYNSVSEQVTVTVNPLPTLYSVAPGGDYCEGGTGVEVKMLNSQAAISYTLHKDGVPTTNIVTGTGGTISFGQILEAGDYTILAINPVTTCQQWMTGTATVVVNPLPQQYLVTGGGQYPSGGVGVPVGISGSQSGVNYTLNLNGAPVTMPPGLPGNGDPLSFGNQLSAGLYTVEGAFAATGCSIMMSGNATVVINPYPSIQNVFGGGALCQGEAGRQVGLDDSEVGVLYIVYRNMDSIGNAMGTGDSLVLGTYTITGTYTVKGINTNNNLERMMRGSAVITVNPLPTVFTLVPSGGQCPGTELFVNGSEAGFDYIVYRNNNEVDTVTGNGQWALLPLGAQYDTGYYWVRAENPSTGCGVWLNDTTRINPSPTAYHVMPAGILCQGQPIWTDGSETGISYQLVRDESTNVGAPLAGNGAPLSFGPQTYPGTYKVLATNVVTNCSRFLLDSAVLYAAPTAFTIMPWGDTCAPAEIGLSGSENGYTYGLYLDNEYPPLVTLTGSGMPLAFGSFTFSGTYTVKATNEATQCESAMAGSLTLAPAPNIYNLLPAGLACPGDPLSLDNSEAGTLYQLYRNDSLPVGTPVAGTGSALVFGPATLPGTYTVIGYVPGSGCSVWMNGMAEVEPSPVLFSITPAGQQCSGVTLGLNGSEAGVEYRLIRDNQLTTPIAVLTGTGSLLSFGPQHVPGTYTVVAYRPVSGCHAAMQESVVVNPRPVVFDVLPAGANCEPDEITLSGSETGVSYQLLEGGLPLVPPVIVAGTGTAITFGVQMAGTYTVEATVTATNCPMPMNGTALISPLPVVQAGNDTLLCRNDLLPLRATATGYSTIGWSTSGNGTFSNAAILNPVYTPGSADLAAGSVTLTITVTGTSECPATTVSDNLLVTFHPLPQANAGSDFAACAGLTAQLNGSATHFNTVLWTTLGDGQWSDPTLLNPVYQPGNGDAASGSVKLVLTVWGDATCGHELNRDTVLLTIEPLPVAMAGNDTTLCETDMAWLHAMAQHHSTATWTTTGDGTFSSPNTLHTFYTPGPADRTNGAVHCIVTALGTATCATTLHRDTVDLFFDLMPTVEAGTDFEVCASAQAVTLNASAQRHTTIAWNTNGFGSFVPANTLVTSYQVNPPDTAMHQVKMVVKVNGSGQCLAKQVADSLQVTFHPLPVALAGNDADLCNGQTITLDGSGYNTSGYHWATLGDGVFSNNGIANPEYTPGNNDLFNQQFNLVLTTYGTSTCLTETDTDTVHVTMRALPTGVISGQGEVCEGDPVVLNVVLTGTPPWNMTVTNGLVQNTFSQIMVSPYQFELYPEVNCVYTLASLNDAYCTGTDLQGEALVQVNPAPNPFTLTAPNGGYFCQGDTGIQLTLNGSQVGIEYQLLRSGMMVGAPLAGTGNALGFGMVNLPGYYTVLATNPLTVCQATMPGGVQVIEYPEPDVDFVADSVCSGISYTFGITGTDQAEIVAWNWNFGDGQTVSYATAIAPTHTYLTHGTYVVTLSVTDFHGCNHQVSHPIEVMPLPVALFGYSMPACLNDTVHFTNLSYTFNMGYIAQWDWDFGDGNTATVVWPDDPNLGHPYTLPGLYDVTLTVTSNTGCTHSLTRQVQVSPRPVANFAWDGACQREAVQFTDLTQSSITGQVMEWSWNFGDPASGAANTATVQHPQHIFSHAGTYTVTLVAFTANGCTDSISHAVTVETGPVALFAADTACLGSSTTFSDLSVAGAAPITAWEYQFGDGTAPSNLPNPVHAYAVPGTWQATLTLTDANGCHGDTTLPVLVSENPQALFTVSDQTCAGSQVSFHNLSTASQGYVTQWEWSFGDGQSQSVVFPENPDVEHSYTLPGNYQATLTVTTSLGCTASFSQMVTITTGPVANFTTGLITCAETAVQFTDQTQTNGSGVVISRQWNFGDPLSGTQNTSTLTNPMHVFPMAGSYTVTLVVNASNGCTDTIVKPVIIYAVPHVLFSADTACQGQPTHFTDLSTTTAGNIQQWEWNFGDGSPLSNTQNPEHLYLQAGTYQVMLRVMNSNNCWNDTTLQVVVRALPFAAYAVTTQNCNGVAVAFNDLSSVTTGFINTWIWTYGDGTRDTMHFPSNPDTLHLYSGAGTYPSILKVITNHGCTATAAHLVAVNESPVANFDASLNSCAGQTVQFTNLSQAPGGSPVVSWQWDFGDPGSGVNNTSMLENPQHVYDTAATYAVTLIVANTNLCTDTIVKPIAIVAAPLAAFVADSVCQGTPTTFTDQSTSTGASVSQWLWNFGDGSTSSQQNPVHSYNNWGTYTVTLLITNVNGCTDDTTLTVFVKPVPAPAFTSTGTCSGVAVQFADASSTSAGTLSHWWWEFGDGDTSSLQNPLHTYSGAGAYTVDFTVTNSYGCEAQLAQTLNISGQPVAAYNYYSVYCPAGEVSFQDVSTGNGSPVATRTWDFGNGFTTSSPNPVYTYPDPDSCYTVTLTVTNAAGCSDTAVQTVCVKPGFSFTFEASESCSGHPVVFTPVNLATGDTLLFVSWNFGDPASGPLNTSIGRNPEHTYSGPGQYLVQLKAWNSDNCVDSIFRWVNVRTAPLAGFTFDEVPHCDTTVLFTSAVAVNGATIDSVVWLFGDSTVTDLPPVAPYLSHTFPAYGIYAVTQTVYVENGCSGTLTDTVSVKCLSTWFEQADTLLCSGKQVVLNDLSEPRDQIDQWLWLFGDGTFEQYTTWRPTISHVFDTAGLISTRLITTAVVNGHTVQDTAWRYLRVEPSPRAGFTTGVLCSNQPVVFTDTSRVEFGTLASCLWNFGDGHTDTVAVATHSYAGSRDYLAGLRVVTAAGCTDTTSRLISLVAPPPVWLVPPDTLLCGEGALITFADTSGIIHQSYLWRFGDGDSLTTSETTVSHEYGLGNYTATLTVTNASSGCQQADTSLIAVKPRPTAAFTWSPDSVSVYDGTFSFRNESFDGESLIVDWHWLFGDGTDTLAQSPTHRYNDTGWWQPRLVVTNLEGCTDTAQGRVRVFPELTFFIPNAFSPGYDQLNNTFRPVRRYGQSSGYLFQVYNRWGMLVFETADPDAGWNGRFQNQGDELPSGAYAWIITMHLDNGAPRTEKGLVMLVR